MVAKPPSCPSEAYITSIFVRHITPWIARVTAADRRRIVKEIELISWNRALE